MKRSRLMQMFLAAAAVSLWLSAIGMAQVEAPQQEAPASPGEAVQQPDVQQETPLQAPQGAEGRIQQRGEVQLEGQATQQDRRDAQGRTAAEGQVDLGLQFGETTEEGLTVDAVQQQGIAAQAGLRQGDRILSVDGRRFSSSAELNAFLGQRRDRGRVPVTYWRDGRQYSTVIMLGQAGPGQFGPAPPDRFPPGPGQQVRGDQFRPQGGFGGHAALGVSLQQGQQGVLITAVHEGSPAFLAQLAPGDEIVSINGQPTCDIQEVICIIQQHQPGQHLQLGVIQQGQHQIAQVQLDVAERAFAGQPIRWDQMQAQGRMQQQGQFQGDRFGAPPAPPMQGQRGPDGRVAQAPRQQQDRQALRPDFDAMSRIEQLQQQVDTLQRENEQLRSQLEGRRGQSGQQQDTRPDAAPAAPPRTPTDGTSTPRNP